MMVSPVAVGATAVSGVLALTFTPADTLAVIAASAALVTAIGAVVVNVIVALRTNAKVDSVAATTKTIEGHVNSAASASIAKIDGLQSEIALLRSQLADRKETAALLAQAVVARESPALSPPDAVKVEVVNQPLTTIPLVPPADMQKG